jgi:hypothetical protein
MNMNKVLKGSTYVVYGGLHACMYTQVRIAWWQQVCHGELAN